MTFGKRTPPPSSGDDGAPRGDVVVRAADDIAQALLGAYKNERGVHAESVIGAAAAVTADSARANSLNAIPGVNFASGTLFGRSSVDAILFEKEDSVWNIITRMAVTNLGIGEEKLPGVSSVIARTAAAYGSQNFPPLSVPREHYPIDWSPLAGPRLRPSIDVISDHHGLQGDERALAGAVATFTLVQMTQEVLDPVIGLTLALEMLVGATRIPVDMLEKMAVA